MLVEQFLPEAKKLINDKIISVVKAQGPKVALSKVYNMFPFYVRAIVKEETFVKFCLTVSILRSTYCNNKTGCRNLQVGLF